ncbi:MAG: hypothetical protein AB7E24_00320 [Novosphingobium sp.]
MKRARPTYPRVNCLVSGCKRGTTRAAPHDDGTPAEIICGKHWRTVPKAWRSRLSLYGRRYRAAERKDDQRGMDIAARCWWQRWERIKQLLLNPEAVMTEDLPATMVQELKSAGLL